MHGWIGRRRTSKGLDRNSGIPLCVSSMGLQGDSLVLYLFILITEDVKAESTNRPWLQSEMLGDSGQDHIIVYVELINPPHFYISNNIRIIVPWGTPFIITKNNLHSQHTLQNILYTSLKKIKINLMIHVKFQ